MSRALLLFIMIAGMPAVGYAILPPIPHLPESVLQEAANLARRPTSELESAQTSAPTQLAERIAANSRQVGERLAADDPGEQTRRQQHQILKDIDALLQMADKPPPPSSASQSGETNDQRKNSTSAKNPPSSSQNSTESSEANSTAKIPPQLRDSASTTTDTSSRPAKTNRSGWRDRVPQQDNAPAKQRRSPMTTAAEASASAQPSNSAENNLAKDPPQQAGASANRPQAGSSGSVRATLAVPNDLPYTKQIWGHLPEQMRQQMTQYYREQFVSKYGELLRQYYSSLSERNKPANTR